MNTDPAFFAALVPNRRQAGKAQTAGAMAGQGTDQSGK